MVVPVVVVRWAFCAAHVVCATLTYVSLLLARTQRSPPLPRPSRLQGPSLRHVAHARPLSLLRPPSPPGPVLRVAGCVCVCVCVVFPPDPSERCVSVQTAETLCQPQLPSLCPVRGCAACLTPLPPWSPAQGLHSFPRTVVRLCPPACLSVFCSSSAPSPCPSPCLLPPLSVACGRGKARRTDSPGTPGDRRILSTPCAGHTLVRRRQTDSHVQWSLLLALLVLLRANHMHGTTGPTRTRQLHDDWGQRARPTIDRSAGLVRAAGSSPLRSLFCPRHHN